MWQLAVWTWGGAGRVAATCWDVAHACGDARRWRAGSGTWRCRCAVVVVARTSLLGAPPAVSIYSCGRTVLSAQCASTQCHASDGSVWWWRAGYVNAITGSIKYYTFLQM